jgi:peptidoglycan/LPS O-acetylase OafA/YrhL
LEFGSGTLIASVTLLPIGRPALNVAWTLQHEVLFYAVFALGLASGWWRAGLALWLGGIVGLAVSGVPAPIGLQLIDAEFLMGLAAWAAWRDGRRPVMLLTSAGLVIAGVLLHAGDHMAGIPRGWAIGCAALFAAVLPWLVRAEAVGMIHTPRQLRFLGDASYAIYLAHGIPLLLLAPLWTHLGWQAGFAAMTMIGLAAGIGYHLLVERPLLARFPKRPGSASPT